MPISIKREDTVRLARAIKLQTGKPMARVIHEALEESFGRLCRRAEISRIQGAVRPGRA